MNDKKIIRVPGHVGSGVDGQHSDVLVTLTSPPKVGVLGASYLQ
jgi:hypothetical protein